MNNSGDKNISEGGDHRIGNATLRDGVDVGRIVAQSIEKITAEGLDRKSTGMVDRHLRLSKRAPGERRIRFVRFLINKAEPWLYRLRGYFMLPVTEQLARIARSEELLLSVVETQSRMQLALERLEVGQPKVQSALGRLETFQPEMQSALNRLEADKPGMQSVMDRIDASQPKLHSALERVQTCHYEIQSALEAITPSLKLAGSVQPELQSVMDRIQSAQSEMQSALTSVMDQQAETRAALERIETYALATAKRVAVPAGEGRLLVRTEIGYIVCSSEDTALSAILLESGELEPGVRRLIQKILRPGDVFVDVGANIGMHTIAAAQSVKPEGRVIAFEPYPPTVSLLRQSIFLNGFSDIVEIRPCAVANLEGDLPIYLGATSGHHSLYAPLEGASKKTVNVSIVRLDDVIKSDTAVKIVKIDVEGAEIDVIRGAVFTLRNNWNIGLIVEFGLIHIERSGYAPQQWLAVFQELGFSYRVIDPLLGTLKEVSMQELLETEATNLLFLRPESDIWNVLDE